MSVYSGEYLDHDLPLKIAPGGSWSHNEHHAEFPTTRYYSKMVWCPLSSWLKSTRIDCYKWRTHEAGTKRAGTVGGSQVCNGGRNRCLVPICCKGNSCPEHRRWEYNFTLILTILAIGGEVKLCLSSITRQDGEVEDTHGYFNDASDLVMMKTA